MSAPAFKYANVDKEEKHDDGHEMQPAHAQPARLAPAAPAIGLCNCFDDINTTMNWAFCPWCSISNTYNTLDNGTSAYDCGSCMFTGGSDLCTRGATTPFWSYTIRRQVHQRFNLPHEPYHYSCIVGSFLPCCSNIQMAREMTARDYNPGGVCTDNSLVYGGGCERRPNAPQAPYATGLCQCSATECLDAFFCLPCMIGYMTSKLNKIDYEAKTGYQHPNKDALEPAECLLSGCCGGSTTLYALRRDLAGRFGVGQEDTVTSCLITSFCAQCAGMQMRREMAIRGHWSGGVCQSLQPANLPPPVQMAPGSPQQQHTQAAYPAVPGYGQQQQQPVMGQIQVGQVHYPQQI